MLEILSNYPWARLSVIKRQFFFSYGNACFDNSNLSQEILQSIDTVRCSLGHGRKHMLTILPAIWRPGFKATFHLTISVRVQRATGKVQRNNYHHGSCGSSLTSKTMSVFLIFTQGTQGMSKIVEREVAFKDHFPLGGIFRAERHFLLFNASVNSKHQHPPGQPPGILPNFQPGSRDLYHLNFPGVEPIT